MTTHNDSTTTHETLIDEVERLIDTHGLAAFLETTATVCNLKADHIRENWQDDATAQPWDRMGSRLATQVRAAGKLGLTR